MHTYYFYFNLKSIQISVLVHIVINFTFFKINQIDYTRNI